MRFFTWQRLILVGKKMPGGKPVSKRSDDYLYDSDFLLFFQLFSYGKVLQPVLWPTCGSQPPMLNPECGQKIIVADGRNYANSTIRLCLY
jgi:hypothetical protein